MAVSPRCQLVRRPLGRNQLAAIYLPTSTQALASLRAQDDKTWPPIPGSDAEVSA